MEDWKVKKIKAAITDLKKEEARQFAIAYAELPEEFHGYMQFLPQQTQVWFEQADKEVLDSLKKEHGWDRVSAWNGKTFFTVHMPYLGIDGYLAILAAQYDSYDIKTDVLYMPEVHKILLIAQIKVAQNGVHAKSVQGIVDVPYLTKKDPSDNKKKVVVRNEDGDGKAQFDNIEISTSQAIRKALHLLGDGRFPLYKTNYGDHAMIAKFRKFVKAEKDKEKDGAED